MYNNDLPKVVVKHSRIEVNNYDWGDCPKLEYIFSVYDPIRHTSFIKGIEYDEENKRLYLPRGIDMYWVENTFCCTPIVDKKYDNYINSDPVPIKYLTRNERQLEVLKFILGEDKYNYTQAHSQLAIFCTTGFGKTFVTIASICFTGTRAIIITSSIDWLNQWKEKILEYTPLSEKQIYMIAGSASIDKIFNRDPMEYNIFLASHSTLKSYGDRYGWDKIDDLFKHLKCGMKVYDEAHLYFDNICKIDYHSNTKKTLYLTATPQRSNADENNIYQLYFKNIPSIDLFDEELDPHTHYMAIHFNSHPTPYDIKNCKGGYGFNRINYTNYVVGQEYFLKLVTILVDMLLPTPGKILVYIGTNYAIRVVYEHIISEFPFLDGNVGIYTSTVKDNKAEQLYKKIILSTTKSAGAASDISELDCTVNLAEPFKSPVIAKQTLGRTRADDTLYIDIVDTGFYYTKKYYQEKKMVFSKYAKTCRDIRMDDNEIDARIEEVHSKYDYTKPMICKRIFSR